MSQLDLSDESLDAYLQDGPGAAIRGIMEDLNTSAEISRTRMPEAIFVAGFLPLFAGEKDKIPKGITLEVWARVAGNDFAEVDVVDARGNVLFTVPALFERSAFNSVKGQRVGMSHVILTHQQYNHQSPALGSRYLDEELSKRQMLADVPEAVLINLERWNAIYTRYGRPPLMKLENSAAAPAAKTDDKIDDEDNWEPA